MSRDYWLFEGENPETAYMAGVVDVLGDNLSMVCDFPYTLDVDIFFVKDNDLSALDSTIKKRLHAYNEKEGHQISPDKIDALDFHLEKVDTNVKDCLKGLLAGYSSAGKLDKMLDDFFLGLNWYLRKPTCIYVEDTKKHGKIRDILGRIYLYVAFDYLFIGYDEWAVLFVVGTVE